MTQIRPHDDAPTVGDRIAEYRYRRHLTQEQLAEASGLSLSAVKAIERGARGGRMATLNRLARALGVRTSDLLAPARGVNVTTPDEPNALLAIRRALTPPLGVEIERRPADATAWNDTLKYAERLYDQDRYDQALEAVPILIDEARAHDDPRALAHAYIYAGRTLTQVRQLDLANHALHEAMRLAHQTSDEILASWVVAHQCWTLLLQSRFGEVEQMAVQAAQRIEPRMSDADSVQIATWGWLMLYASAAAIRDADVDTAAEYMRQARTAGAGIGQIDRTQWLPAGVSGFNSSTVGYKQVENAALLGEHGKALELAAKTEPSAHTPASDRNRHHLDVAASYMAEHRTDAVVETLLNVRTAAPEWLRHQGYARGIVDQLVETRRRAFADEVGILADHMGILV